MDDLHVSKDGPRHGEVVHIEGTLYFATKLSASLGFLTLLDRVDHRVHDVLVKTGDGWSTEAITQLFAQLGMCKQHVAKHGSDARVDQCSDELQIESNITVDGYVERIRSSSKSLPLICIHAQEIVIQFVSNQKLVTFSNSNNDLSTSSVTEQNDVTKDSPLPSLQKTKDEPAPFSKKKRTSGSDNQKRFSCFADWLLSEFHSELQFNSIDDNEIGVLDVAGGAGFLAFELGVRRNIPCVVIDPRAPLPANDEKADCIGNNTEIKMTSYVYSHRHQPALNRRLKNCQKLYPVLDSSALAQELTHRWNVCKSKLVRSLFDEQMVSTAVGKHLIDRCRVVIGLHPDEALDAIIQVAMKHGKPWVVVPCCVFRNHFTGRRLPNGDKVTTYDDLVKYVATRAKGVRQTTLDFPGRNIVLWWRPEYDSLHT